MRQFKKAHFIVITLLISCGLALMVIHHSTRRVRTATTITVMSGGDGGAGTLRQAVMDAMDGDTIQFVAGLPTITLTSGEILINKSVTISGPGRVCEGAARHRSAAV